MKKLLKEYGFFSDMEYYQMIVDSVYNGNRTQAKEQFNALPRKLRKVFLVAIYGNWDTGLNTRDQAMFMNEI